MINSRAIDALDPRVADKCRAFVQAAADQGIDILITSTFRDFESQAALYAQGRSTPGNIVTNAPAGHSFHTFRCAFDFVPLVNGKPAWNDLALFHRCGEIGKSVGLEWAGDWVSFREYAHLQDAGGRTLAQLRADQTSVA